MLGGLLDIFSRASLAYLSRWAHVVVGITWIGLLYYFNFVQTPAFAQMEAGARNNAVDKLASRALWWFRWSAAATVATGILILIFYTDLKGDAFLVSGDFWKSPEGVAIATGILLALTMFVNVWGIIWRNQKIVIANARNVQAGGEADPNAASAGRLSALASRQNTIFSFPMLIFMVGAAHFPYRALKLGHTHPGNVAIYWIITIIIWALLEANALGWLGGTSPGGTRTIYETHQNAIITGLVLCVIWLALFSWVLTT
jgi:uncharacterized membrane protein